MPPVTPEPAATVALVREQAGGLEVYLTCRRRDLVFLGGFHVFPGGKLDPEDFSPVWPLRCKSARKPTGVVLGRETEPGLALAFRIAGIREVFEETGVLLAEGSSWPPAERLENYRRELHARRRNFLSILEAEDLYLPLERLLWFAHWVTPATSPRRFDTHFFAAAMPAGQEAKPFPGEISASSWERPAAAIARWKRREIKLIPPTLASLDFLSRFSDWEALAEQLAPENLCRRGDAALGVEMAGFSGKQGGG